MLQSSTSLKVETLKSVGILYADIVCAAIDSTLNAVQVASPCHVIAGRTLIALWAGWCRGKVGAHGIDHAGGGF